MRLALALTAALAASVATAQQQIPIPAFQNTFSSSSATRGFYFQAPVAFTVVGLRVPDETNHGLQNVAVYKMTAKPPAFSASATGGLQFYKGGVASSLIIQTNVPINVGDWFGVLGACGDASTMRNSYGSIAPMSMILGQPTTLLRFLTQTNLVSTQGTGAYSSEDAFQISRIEVYITGTSLQGSGTGAPGTAMNFGLTAPRSAGLPYVMASSLGTGPIPIDTRSIGLSLDGLFSASVSNTLPTVFANYTGVIGASGRASGALNIPPFPILKGIIIHSAFVTVDAPSPSGIKEISNTFTFTIT